MYVIPGKLTQDVLETEKGKAPLPQSENATKSRISEKISLVPLYQSMKALATCLRICRNKVDQRRATLPPTSCLLLNTKWH